MRKIATAFLSLAVTAGLLLSPTLGRAQDPSDYPNLKGSNARTGMNGDPRNSTPGFLNIAGIDGTGAAVASSLRWFRTGGATFDVAVDNTDDGNVNQVDSSGAVVGPFDPQPFGVVARNPVVANLSARVTGPLSPAAGWAVTDEDGSATFLYTPIRRNNAITIGATTFQRDFNPRFAGYEFTEATPSAPGQDPRVASVPANRRTFTWTLNTPNPTPRNLALYVSLPVGTTLFGGIQRIQQRYFVYEITYGSGQKYVDVVDTDVAGAGFVRLGNGGRATDQVFPTDGVTPVTITLYNTIPRDRATGNLLQTTLDANGRPRLVYADAVRFTDSTGTIYATPTAAGFGGADRRVISARNDSGLLASVTSNDIFARPAATPRGTVTSHDYNTGLERWTYIPDEAAPENSVFDESTPAFAPSVGFTSANGRDNPTPNAFPANAQTTYGGTYLRAAAITGTVVVGNNTAATDSVLVDPGVTALPTDVTYEITTYLSGVDAVGVPNFVSAVQYEIFEGTVSAGVFTLNQRNTRGFVRLGNRRYAHTVASPLSVRIYNTSSVPADAGREIMVDAVRFNGSGGNAISSTPVHVTALIRQDATNPPVPTNVVLVADERGRIHCVDASGNGDGTTKVYWTYPSTPTVAGQDTDGTPLYKDPNTNVGLGVNDGGLEYDGEGNDLQADMPPGFDLSTAAVVNQTVFNGAIPLQRDFLLIGGTNGRVYCIAMEGRGDLTATAPGTTYRRWTFPDTSPSPLARASTFGKITSIVTGDFGGSTKAIFGTEVGRMHSVEVLGLNPATGTLDTSLYGPSTRATRQAWQYPAANVATLGAVEGAPALDVANNRLFFGTLTEETVNGTLTSHLVSLNATTGAMLWDAFDPGLLSWRSGPAYVPATELENVDLVTPSVPLGTTPDMLFAMNENGSVYGINAASGVSIWRTDELQSGGRGSLGYMRLLAEDRTGTPGLFPTITVPTEGGRFAALFARLGDETAFTNFVADPVGPRVAWGARVNSPIVASMTTLGSPTGLDGFLYGATADGTIYAWSGNAVGGGGGIFNPPYVEDVVDNNDDPAYAPFRNAELALLSRDGFVRLRQTQANTATNIARSVYNYGDVIDPGQPITSPTNPFGRLRPPYRSTRTSPAFEWGETIYLILYNFPAPSTNSAGDEIAPPIVEVTVTTEGRASRPIQAEARIFADRDDSSGDGGYAVVQVPLTSGGNTALTPGPGLVSVALRSSVGNRNFVQQAISLRPGQSRINYTIANPLAIAMPSVTPDNRLQIGRTNNAGDPDNVNGSPNVANPLYPGRDSSLLGTTVGNVQHGQSGRTLISVYDRSLMTLLRGEGRGLENVRVDRRDLEWQGGVASMVKDFRSIHGALFAKFEDLPDQIPNISLDYPDIRRDRVAVTKDPAGAAENAVLFGVGLSGPRIGTGNLPANFVTDANASSRNLVSTPFEFKLDVPRYQPPAFVSGTSLVPDSAGSILAQGYAGRYSVYVDSDNNSLLGINREAYRSFNLFGRVAPDERLVVTTPTVDLGALAGGAGYEPSLGYTGVAPFRTMADNANPNRVSPWGGPYTRLFAPFTVLNEGNVNLVNVRVAKGSRDGTGATTLVFPWQTFSLLNDESSAWHDASLDLWSDLDQNFAPQWGANPNNNQVIGQKPRVTDIQGRAVQANPVSRPNPNLPASGTALLAGREPRDPRIGITVPIGFPMGPYSQTFRIIEDYRVGTPITNDDELLELGYQQGGRVDPQESYSDPGVRVAFTVTETQLTGGTSNLAPKMVDLGNAIDAGATSGWASRQPAAARALNGAVAMVFSSNRPEWEPTVGTSAGGSDRYRLWISTLAGGAPGNPRTGRSPDSQTRDLNQFVPVSATNWWGQQNGGGPGGGYPNGTAAALFPSVTGAEGTPLEGSQSFGLPALPVTGFSDPATYGTPGATGYTGVTLAFVGNVNRAGAAGTLIDSRLFASTLGVAADGSATVSAPVAMPFDPTSRKGKPAVVESSATGGQGATIVYPVVSGNASSLYVTRFQGGVFSQPIPIDLGTAFESAGEPSAAIRFPINSPNPVLEIGFAGRLRGRSGNEIFQMALLLDANTHLPLQPFRYIQYRVRGERATFDAASGTYRVRGAYLREPFVDNDGIAPDETYDDAIYLRNPAGTVTDLRDAATRRTDRDSRIESSSSRIVGGQVYLDRGAGSVRSVGGALPRTAEVTLNYDAYVIRLTGNDGSGYGSPTLMKDSRLAPSNTNGTYDAYWFLPTGAPAPANSLATYADRTYVLFTRAAQPGGQTTRPFMATTRLGIRLDRAIVTNADGSLGETQPFTIAGANGPYQLDPAAGKIYFTRADEGRQVTVTFNGVTRTEAIGIIGERAEEPLPLGRAINENNVAAFFDPVFNLPGESYNRRALIWTFWSSTRNGSPNIFMGTISPKLVPFIPAR